MNVLKEFEQKTNSEGQMIVEIWTIIKRQE